MAAFSSYSFCNNVIASAKLYDYEYFLITVLFVKAKEMLVRKIRVFVASNFYDFLQKIYCGFLKIDLGELE